jgi:tetrahydromethanopterin S-methyltransferase subunit G
LGINKHAPLLKFVNREASKAYWVGSTVGLVIGIAFGILVGLAL